MGKFLTGSAQTGSKIMKNFSLFSFCLTEQDDKKDTITYRFKWNFDGQTGTANIHVRTSDNKIALSSSLDTDSGSAHPFDRPLGLYNDSSLRSVFMKMLLNEGIVISGVYSDAF